ncbi:mediator complex, subunit Med31 [Pavlovales sp. CCMP2436]|nr:mediator complex, subunit Med31 [Pavlovales sp. CCMP2436]|mmetsp:Transcript_15507/g.39390  ORF Transcript_15507/g.39390 Transcript_15507/m.39390 type:complete len:104 (+) Transcript_15507:101-412(+)
MATVPRFELELEFVQALANVDYVAYLARGEMLDDPEFVRFLEYLCYWTRAEYARHLQYPQCLGVLELLQRPSFREALKNAQFVDYLKGQQYMQWLYRASSEGE